MRGRAGEEERHERTRREPGTPERPDPDEALREIQFEEDRIMADYLENLAFDPGITEYYQDLDAGEFDPEQFRDPGMEE